MVVTTGAGDRQAHQSAADDVDPIIDHVVDIAHEPASQSEKPQCRQGLCTVLRGETVGRDLLDQESVVRQVLIEGADDVVAVGVGPVVIRVLKQDVSLGVGIPRHVEPVASPPLAIPWRGQQPVDQAIECIGSACRPRTHRLPRASAATPSSQTMRGGSRSAGRHAAKAKVPVASSFARMNRSIGVRGQAFALTSGGAGSLTG